MSSWSSWRTGSGSHDSGSSYAPTNTTNVNDSNRIEPIFRHSVSFQPTSDATRRDPWQMPDERVIRRPFSFSGFPDHRRTSAPVQIVWLESVPSTPPPARVVNPRFSGPLPRYTVQQQVQLPPAPAPAPAQQDDSRSTQDEENIVLSKLKREIYNPVPKQMTRRLNSYYRNGSSFNEKEKDDDGKRCAICLEDFEPREQVMLTPCDHMFHEECIVPWMKSHGQCPVCRYVLSERIRQTATSISNNNASNVAATETDLFAGELISIIRAMEEAFLWGNSR